MNRMSNSGDILCFAGSVRVRIPDWHKGLAASQALGASPLKESLGNSDKTRNPFLRPGTMSGNSTLVPRGNRSRRNNHRSIHYLQTSGERGSKVNRRCSHCNHCSRWSTMSPSIRLDNRSRNIRWNKPNPSSRRNNCNKGRDCRYNWQIELSRCCRKTSRGSTR